MLAPVRTVAPATTPVSLTEAKAHLRVDHDDDDTLIGALIDAATAHLDGWTGVLGRAIITQTWRQDFYEFSHKLRLPLHPVASITSVTYYDGDNAQQTLSTDVYELLTDAAGAYVAEKADQTWPGTKDRAAAVSVTFVAGEATAPAAIKAAILLLIGHLYENREAVGPDAMSELPMAVSALIAPYRRVGV